MRTRTILLAGLMLFLLSSVAGAAKGVFRDNIRVLGMGNAGIAAGYKMNAFLYNPALLERVGFDLSFPSVRLGFNDDVFDVVDYVKNNKAKFEAFGDDAVSADELLKGMRTFDGQWVRLSASPAFMMAVHNFGIASYSVIRGGVKVDRGIYEPRVFAEAQVDIVEQAGAAHEINDRVVVGAAVKAIQRSSITKKIGASKLGDLGDISDEIQDDVKDFKSGWGLDLGGLYRLQPEKLELGWVLQDLVGNVDGDDLPLIAKIGASYRPVGRLSLAGDYTDLFNRQGDNFFKKFHFGGEYDLTVGNRLGFRLRAGANQGYPTVGLGMRLAILDLDYAFFGEELGRKPGEIEERQHAFQIRLGW